MAKGKIIRAADISEKDILLFYQDILPLFYENPEHIDISFALNQHLLKFIRYDFAHYLVDEFHERITPGKVRVEFGNWERNTKKDFSDISIISIKDESSEASFNEMVEHSYQEAIKRKPVVDPDQTEYHYHRISSKDKPRVAVGFFRVKDTAKDNSFTKDEVRILEKLTPTILLILRTITGFSYQSRTYQYFNTYINIASQLVKKYRLSTMENKLVIDILFGYSNEEIADKNYISIATVKTHLNHIFKKTGTKNRVDFLGKFFTSPTRVEI
jgi:DNA-binding CsgD family transcriptional regulator